MKQTIEQSTAVCTKCRRTLPLTEFYIDKKTQRPDSYCKKCRAVANHNRYYLAYESTRRRSYPVITEIADREERMRLLRRAHRTVLESILRKRKKQREEEANSTPN